MADQTKRTVGKPFEPGQSGNPRGRPKQDYDLAALARTHTKDSIETMAKIMKDEDASASARVAAANGLLDRGWGKAPSTLNVNPSTAFVQLLQLISEGKGALIGEAKDARQSAPITTAKH